MSDVALTIAGVLVGFSLLLFVFYKILKRRLGQTIEAIVNQFFGEPTIKKAFSILGTKSADKREGQAVVDDAMAMVMDSPKMTAFKLVGDALGIDIDSLLEKHGPAKTIEGLMQLAGMFGINVADLLKGGVLPKGLIGGDAGSNPFLKRG